MLPFEEFNVLFATRRALNPELSQDSTLLKAIISLFIPSSLSKSVNSPYSKPDIFVSRRFSFSLKTVISPIRLVSKFI